MSCKTSTLLLLSLFFFSTHLMAQQKRASKIYKQKQMRLVEVDDPAISTANFFSKYASEMGLDEASVFQLQRTIKGQNGFQHHKYQQVYQSIPVFGSAYILHEIDGRIKNANGYYLPFLNLEVNPSISAEKAIELAMQKMDAKTYMWESERMSSIESIHERPQADLYIIDPAFPKASEQNVLAYKVELFSAEPYDRQQYFIDAQNGSVLLQFPLLHDHAVPAVGVTHYYGEQDIIVDSIAPGEFYLADYTRGDGITTYIEEHDELVSHEDTYWDLTNEDRNEVAIDGHYCATEFYDYLLETFNWNGLGNQGEALVTVVNGGDFVNAFWNGTYAFFGDGNCNAGPLTTLEVVAHEFTHGLTDYTSDLIYSGESGAINESMSDVFGKALEFKIDPTNFEWTIGASFLETEFAFPFRSMEDPNIFEHPKYYKGEFWTDGGGVHTNSSVGNHWFYSLVTGGSGVNEIGESYNIEAIGMDKAIQVSFRLQTSYLTSNSSYPVMHEASILAAKEIFGENAPEVESVIQAWKKVGLPYVPTTQGVDLRVEFNGFIEYTCLSDEFFPVEVTISNVGGVAYTPDMNGSFDIEEEYFQDLETDILPGEMQTFMIDDYLFVDDNGTTTIYARITLDIDENTTNNSDYLLVINSLYPADEMELYTAGLSPPNCFDNNRTLTVRVRNNSCGALLADTPFTIKMTNPNSSFEWEQEFTMPLTLLSRQIANFEEVLIDFPQEDGELIVELIYPADNDLSNNERPINLTEPKSVLEGEYLLDFSETNYAADDILRHFIGNPIVEYNGESYFGTTGLFPTYQANLCADALDNFTSFARQRIEICANLQQDIPYLLEFDLVQFRNPESATFPELSEFTTMLKVSWIDVNTEQSDELLIYNQTEGEIEHHTMDLPLNFQGQIFFEFINISGTFNDEEAYFDYDVNLLDNLQVTELVVSTENPVAQKIKIHPNPTNSIFTIQHIDQAKHLIIRNIHGQEVMTLNNNRDLSKVDLSALANGYYLLSVYYPNELVVTQPIVKVGR